MNIMFFEIKSSEYTDDFEFVVAFSGASSKEYLDKDVFSLQELFYIKSLTCFDIPTKENPSFFLYDEDKLSEQIQEEMNKLIALCKDKMLFVISDLDDCSELEACCDLADNVGDNGFPVFVTHKNNRNSDGIKTVQEHFKHIIFVSDEVSDLFCAVKLFVRDFIVPGFNGVDLADAFYPIRNSESSFYIQKKFGSVKTIKKALPDLFNLEIPSASDNSKGLWFVLYLQAARNSCLEDVDTVAAALRDRYPDCEMSWTCGVNKDEADKSWTASLLYCFADTESEDTNIDELINELLKTKI